MNEVRFMYWIPLQIIRVDLKELTSNATIKTGKQEMQLFLDCEIFLCIMMQYASVF